MTGSPVLKSCSEFLSASNDNTRPKMSCFSFVLSSVIDKPCSLVSSGCKALSSSSCKMNCSLSKNQFQVAGLASSIGAMNDKS